MKKYKTIKDGVEMFFYAENIDRARERVKSGKFVTKPPFLSDEEIQRWEEFDSKKGDIHVAMDGEIALRRYKIWEKYFNQKLIAKKPRILDKLIEIIKS